MAQQMDQTKDVFAKHYDIGVYGWWGHDNFGGCLTYFALERTLKHLGHSVLMIQEASGLPGRYIIPDSCLAMKFAHENYECSPQVDYKDLKKFNQICDKFIVGGDQLWNYRIHFVKEDTFLNFVDDDKIKASYSTSFGAKIHTPKSEDLAKYAPLLQRFDSISVREDYAVDIAKNVYRAQAEEIIDAVFLPDKSEYEKLAARGDCELPKEYMVAYILNPTQEKRRQVEAIAKKLNLELVVIPDAAAGMHKVFNEVFEGINQVKPLSVNNFIKAYANAKYIVTDSFHGACFCYIFKKDFNLYYNENRGADRLVSLNKILKLENRRIFEYNTDEELFASKEVGYTTSWAEADKNVKKHKKFAIDWLKNAFSQKKADKKYPSKIENPELDALYANFDFKKIQILATLFRDYGIKHVVLSPGGRDVPIIRMFEHNEGSFVLHRVTDERSAAYYAMGIATQLRQPVACICTSGTAASNYLPAVTEAYFTGIPLIVVTADRYAIYHGHGEDQTIPQQHIYSEVVKKEVSLPDVGGYFNEYQTRRDISDCILEATHNGFGPVHINIPINDISIGSRVDGHHWSLLPKIYPHILRVGFNDGEKEMYKWVDSLKKSPRILVVYGQNAPLSQEEYEDVNRFASKYNCAIVTDTISNFSSEYSINSYNLLNSMSQDEFNRELAPDILITVGGKRLMNDPLTFKIRGAKGVRHWHVAPDGKVRDFYFALSSVIESTQKQFFKWFANHAGEAFNNGEYLNKWKKFQAERGARPVGGFNALTIQRSFIPAIPANSMLHLGVGQSFFDVRRYNIDPSVEVYCNMGTNGIDGCTSTFLGQCSVLKDKLCFLLVGDLSFFYDMNSIWNKPLQPNMRILLVNNNGTGLLKGHGLRAVTSVHNTVAEGWVRSTGFDYISAKSEKEFEDKLKDFLNPEIKKPIFFEVFCDR